MAANNHRRTSYTSSRKPSLAFGDTPDGFRDLGHLELMSRELDPTGMHQLNRSISTDSLSSISSIANNFGHDYTVGQLEVTLEFEPSGHPGQGAGMLHIALHQGKDLLEREEGDFPGCFIRVSLGPEELSVGVTRVRRLVVLVSPQYSMWSYLALSGKLDLGNSLLFPARTCFMFRLLLVDRVVFL